MCDFTLKLLEFYTESDKILHIKQKITQLTNFKTFKLFPSTNSHKKHIFVHMCKFLAWLTHSLTGIWWMSSFLWWELPKAANQPMHQTKPLQPNLLDQTYKIIFAQTKGRFQIIKMEI